MIEQINKELVFYFEIECPNCRNKMNVSHEVIEEHTGALYCTLCSKGIRVPDYEKLVEAAKTLNAYIGDSMNAKHVNLILNPNFESEDDTPAAH